jgi:lysozyme
VRRDSGLVGIVTALALAVSGAGTLACAGPSTAPQSAQAADATGAPAEGQTGDLAGAPGGPAPTGNPPPSAAPPSSPTQPSPSASSASSPSSANAPAATPARLSPAEALGRLHQGIDVSWHSGQVDWRQVAAEGHGFVVIKASEGVDDPDPAFAEHWRGAGEAGLVRGAYHFYVTEDDPEAQARLFIDTVELEPGDLVPVVDVELIGHNTQPGLADRLRTYLGIIEEHFGAKPIIYTGANFWDAHLTPDFGDYPLWVAEYGVAEPRIPAGWETWHLWQWQGDVQVQGVEKEADLSRTNRPEVDLTPLLVPAE